jgi:hypothetical protein
MRLRAAVLGAGGCALPLFLAGLSTAQGGSPLGFASVVAVEASSDVVDVARRFFLDALTRQDLVPSGRGDKGSSGKGSGKSHSSSGSDNSESGGAPESPLPPLMSHGYWVGDHGGGCALTLVHGRAEGWLADSADLVDLLVVDLEDGSSSSIDGGSDGDEALVAPPAWCLAPAFFAQCAARLAPRGVLAVHVVGTTLGQQAVAAALTAAGLPTVHRAAHAGAEGGREVAFFAQRRDVSGDVSSDVSEPAGGHSAGTGGNVNWLAGALNELPPLVDDPATWSFTRIS